MNAIFDHTHKILRIPLPITQSIGNDNAVMPGHAFLLDLHTDNSHHGGPHGVRQVWLGESETEMKGLNTY